MRHIRAHSGAAVNVTAVVYDAATGVELSRQATHNLVTLVGRNMIRDALDLGSVTPPSRFALGTGNTAVAASQVGLAAEVWRDVFTAKTTGSASIEIKYFLTSIVANGNTLREAGLFNAASGGDMYARVVFTEDIVKTSSIAVLFVWTLSWSAS